MSLELEYILWTCKCHALRGDRRTDGRTDGRYQVHFLPRFAVNIKYRTRRWYREVKRKRGQNLAHKRQKTTDKMT